MDLQIISKILEEGGQISCKNYFLTLEDKWNINPDKEWKGYVINMLDINHSCWKYSQSMRLSDALEDFYNVISENNIDE